MIRLDRAATGTIIPVRAQPGARQTTIVGEHDGVLKIAVAAPPDKGKANEAIIVVLAKSFDLPKSAVKLLRGPTSRQKKFLLDGLLPEDARRIIASLLNV